MLVLRVRNVGEFCEADYFEEKKISCMQDATFWPKRNVTHETDDFRELLQMTWLLTFIFKKNQRVTLIDYGFFFKIRNNATDFISLKTYSDFIID